MGDVVNLTRARKAKLRADKTRVADANRAKFGRTKAQRLADQSDRDRREKVVDGAFLQDQGMCDRKPE